MKKIKIVFFVGCFILLGVLCAYPTIYSWHKNVSAEEPKYYLQLEIFKRNGEKICIKPGETIDTPISIGLDTDWNLGINSVMYIKKNPNDVVVRSLIAQPSYSEQCGYYIDEYSITDKKGNTFTAKFQNTFEIYDYTAEFGDLAFECIAGVHKVKFSVNAFSVYGIEKTEFNLSFLVEEDTRADGMEICLSDTSEYTKITSSYFNADSGDYDIYYCKSKPVFKQIIKGVEGYIDESALISFRVLDDNFYSNFPKSLNGLNKGNIYFCQVYCKGTAEYKPANYCCYIIY